MSLSSNSEKEVSSYSSEVLEDVSKHAKDILEILNRQTNRVRKEMETLDEAGKKHEHVHFTDITALSFFPSAITPCRRTHLYSTTAKFSYV